jgi:hypothetical protein
VRFGCFAVYVAGKDMLAQLEEVCLLHFASIVWALVDGVVLVLAFQVHAVVEQREVPLVAVVALERFIDFGYVVAG